MPGQLELWHEAGSLTWASSLLVSAAAARPPAWACTPLLLLPPSWASPLGLPFSLGKLVEEQATMPSGATPVTQAAARSSGLGRAAMRACALGGCFCLACMEAAACVCGTATACATATMFSIRPAVRRGLAGGPAGGVGGSVAAAELGPLRDRTMSMAIMQC